MLRTGLIVFVCFCVAAVIAEIAGAGLLWYRGQLTARTVREIEILLSGADEITETSDEEGDNLPQLSLEQVKSERARQVLDFEFRESQANHLISMAENLRTDVTSRLGKLDAQRKDFEEELSKINQKNTDESTELARGVLMATSPRDAVPRLMELTIEENVNLLKGMPNENIAKILKEFKGDEETIRRGNDIFSALNSGEPVSLLIEQQIEQLRTPPAQAPNTP